MSGVDEVRQVDGGQMSLEYRLKLLAPPLAPEYFSHSTCSRCPILVSSLSKCSKGGSSAHLAHSSELTRIGCSRSLPIEVSSLE